MEIAHVELTDYADPSPIQDWIDAHPTVTIVRVLSSGPHFYIWYTE